MFGILLCTAFLSTTAVAVTQSDVVQNRTYSSLEGHNVTVSVNDIFLYIMSLAGVDGTQKTCRTEGYQYAPATGRCYKYHAEGKLWSRAIAACFSEGAQLLILNNETEVHTINEMFPNRDDVWVYLWSRGNGDWKTSDRIPVEQLYNVWDKGSKPTEGERFCVFRKNGKLDNVMSTYTPYICETRPQDTL